MESKKIVVVATTNERNATWMEQTLNRLMTGSTIFHAHDGLDAAAKIQNVPPHLVIADVELPKMSGLKLVDQALVRKGGSAMAFVLIGQPPEDEHFLDQMVTGQVQYWTQDGDEHELTACLVRALNYSAQHDKAEFHLRFLAQGDILVREGDKAKYVYFVRRGKLQASRMTQDKRVVLGEIDVGEFAGEMAYINGEPRSADVVALTDCELIEVPIEVFGKVLFKRPSWSKALMVSLSRRLKAANEERI